MASELKTYGDIKKLISYIEKKQKGGKIISQGKEIAIDQLLGILPGATNIRSAISFFKVVLSKPDTSKTGTWIDKLDVNDDYSAIVDDTVENGFLKDLVDEFGSIPDEKPLNQDFSMDNELEKYLQKMFNSKTVTGENINKKGYMVNEHKVHDIYNKNKQIMPKNIKNIIKKNINTLVEDHGFEDMEVAFGVDHKNDNLSDAEKNQFGDMEELEKDGEGKTVNLGKPSVDSKLTATQKKSGKDSSAYYKEVSKKMKKFQSTEDSKESQIGEAFEEPKRNVEDSEDFEYNGHMGTGMTGIRYDDEGSQNEKTLKDRMDDLNDEDVTYKELNTKGEEYKDYKYGEKYDEVENEYQDTPRVRTTKKENVMKYSDVIEENIFKTKGKITSKEQVINVSMKVPNRVKIDETVFSITDGDNFYRLIWEGSEDGEAIITHSKNTDLVTEDMAKMKHLWGFKSSDADLTKKNVTESGDDAFRRMYDDIKHKNILG